MSDSTYGNGEPHYTFVTRKACPLTINGLPCSLGRGHRQPCKVDAATVAAMIAERMDRLRETAAELRAGTMNVHRAANRIERIANEIAKAEETTP